MKTYLILSIIIAVFLSFCDTFAQHKVSISLTSPARTGDKFHMDVIATVPAGQVWKVGSSNLRIDIASTPAAGLTIMADNPVVDANTNISGNANYSGMTTSSINSGSAISLNITRLGNCYTLNPGVHVLGKIRFNVNDTASMVTLQIRNTSVLQDSITQLSNSTGWIFINPPANIIINTLVSASNTQTELPENFALYQNYPNPFNSSTVIKYDVPEFSHIKINVYNITGQLITKLLDSYVQPGRYEARWDAIQLTSGIYFYAFESKDFKKTFKMLLIK